MTQDLLFSVSEDFYRYAVVELERELDVVATERVGADAGLVTLQRERIADAAAAAHRCRLPFVKHLAAVLADAPNSELRAGEYAVADWAAQAIAAVDEVQLRGRPVALQVWDSGKAEHKPSAVRRAVVDELAAIGIETVLSGAEHTVSLCLGSKRTVVGLNRAEHSLCDWPGGRLRLGSRPEQVGRAEFKLEELFSHIEPPSGEVAIDLGAAPGGWSRILRTVGFEHVHAVDPGELDPRVLADPGVTHHDTTAGEFLRWYEHDADLVACDMRMPPRLAAEVMNDYADVLLPGGTVVLTLKLGASDPDRAVREALESLSRRYEIAFARQLQHNRHEVTVVGRLHR